MAEKTFWLRSSDRQGTVVAIMLLHVSAFLAVQATFSRPNPQAATPREVTATLIKPEPAHAPATESPVPQPAHIVQPSRPAQPKKVAAKKPAARQAPDPAPVSSEPVAETVMPLPAPPLPSEFEQSATPAPAVAQAPTAPVLPAQPKTVTTGIAYLRPPEPAYPPVSKRMGEQGKTILRVLVNEKGQPEKVEIQRSSGFTRLDEAARLAVQRAFFKPFLDDGRAVAAYAIVPIAFTLEN